MSYYHSINWKSLQPLNDNVVVVLEQEEEVETSKGIILTQMYKPKNHFRILRLPPKFRYDLKANDRILVTRLNANAMAKYLLCPKEMTFLIPTSMILAVWNNATKSLIPIGRRILIERIIHTELDLETKLIKPAFSFEKDQSLDGIVMELGLIENGKKDWDGSISHGDHVVLKQWDASHIEVDVAGKYCLIVPSKDISHIEEREMTLEKL
jgi:co-chaperonin GroES (HSP10)